MNRTAARVLLAKIGLDGHDRGIRVVARALRDAGVEVIYLGLWQSPEQVVRAAVDEDVQAVGISILSGAHMTLIPQLVKALAAQRLDQVRLVVGGIIPNQEIKALQAAGVDRVLGPGASMRQIVDAFAQPCAGDAQPA